MSGGSSNELHCCKQSPQSLGSTPSAYILIEDNEPQQHAASAAPKALELQHIICSKAVADAEGGAEHTLEYHHHEEGDTLLSNPTSGCGAISKINLRILPIFMAVATLNYIDRTNTAFAALQMNRDLKLSAETYGFGSGLFFMGYSIFQIPSVFILMRVGAPCWLSCIVILWGLTAMMFSMINNSVQFCVLRVCLGAFESGAWPGMWYYLSCFYPPDSITVPYSLLEASAGIANTIGAPLAAGLLMMDGTRGWAGWRWLFLIEGLPSVCVGVAMLFILPKDFQSATFFTSADKAWLKQAHVAGHKHQMPHKEGEGLEPPDNLKPCSLLMLAARNRRVWLCSLAAFLKNAAWIGLLFWVPLIVHSVLTGGAISANSGSGLQPSSDPGRRHMLEAAAAVVATPAKGVEGLSSSASKVSRERGVTAVLLTAIPFCTAAVTAVALGHSSQHFQDKCRHVAGPYAIATILLILFPYLMLLGRVATFVFLTLAFTTLTAPNAILNSLASSVSTGPSLALSLALYNAVGNLGGLVGPWFIGNVVQATDLYAAALQVLGIIVGLAAGLSWWMYRNWEM